MATRESIRQKCQKTLRDENAQIQAQLKEALDSNCDQDGFVVKHVNNIIGDGVFVTKDFSTSSFLLEYKGELITIKEGREREKNYAPEKGSFLFFFSYRDKRCCVDATEDPFDLNTARMVNDCHISPNCVMKVVPYKGIPRLCLFATQHISENSELRYDYGVPELPWRKNQTGDNFTCSDEFSDMDEDYVPGSCSESDDEVPNTHASENQSGGSSTHADEFSDLDEDYVPGSCSESDDEVPNTHASENQSGGSSTHADEFSDLDEDYVPGSCSESDDEVLNAHGFKASNYLKACDKNVLIPESSTSSPANQSKILVTGVTKKAGVKRVYDKEHACYYCGAMLKKLSRHILFAHKNEPEVIKASLLDKQDKDRFLKKIRLLGDFDHNISVSANEKGNWIVVRRGQANMDIQSFLPCRYCYGFYSRRELWKHLKICDMKNEDFHESDKQAVKSGKWLLNGSIMPRSEQEDLVRYVLSTLRDDEIATVIKKDSYILQLGNCKLKKLGTKKASVVRDQMRLAARVLCEMRRLAHKPLASFDKFLNPESFDTMVCAAKNICNCMEEKSMSGAIQFEKPAQAQKIGQCLKKLMCLKEGFAIRNKDKAARENAADVLTLYHKEWYDSVNAHAFQTLRERKYNNAELMPLTEDLAKLRKHQISKMTFLSEQMLKTPGCEDIFRKLSLTTLGRISVFNKRREAEVGEMPLLILAKQMDQMMGNSDLFEGLSEFEKGLCKRLKYIEVIGKQQRKVPIILTEDMMSALQVLIKYRPKKLASNMYLFANFGSGHLRTCEALKIDSKEANLSCPELITSTKLRKYMATVSQVVSLTENELEYLANHMGHSITVHRQFYRLQDSAVELAKVSRLLIAAEQGKMGSFAGKSLEDINCDDFPEYSEDEQTESEMFHTIEEKHPQVKRLEDKPHHDELRHKDTSTGNSIPRKVQIRKAWSLEEKTAMSTLVEKSTIKKKPPNQKEILECITENPVLASRKWKEVKFRVWAEVQKMIRKKESLKNSFFS